MEGFQPRHSSIALPLKGSKSQLEDHRQPCGSKSLDSMSLDVPTRSPSSALFLFLGGGFPYKDRTQKKSWYPYSNPSNLEDLANQRLSFGARALQLVNRGKGAVSEGSAAPPEVVWVFLACQITMVLGAFQAKESPWIRPLARKQIGLGPN